MSRGVTFLSVSFAGYLLMTNLASSHTQHAAVDLKYLPTCTSYESLVPGTSSGGAWIPENCLVEHLPPGQYGACLARLSIAVIGDGYGREFVKGLPEGVMSQAVWVPSTAHGFVKSTEFMTQEANVILVSIGKWDITEHRCGVAHFYEGVKDILLLVRSVAKRGARIVLRGLPRGTPEVYRDVLKTAASCTGTPLFDISWLPLTVNKTTSEELGLFLNSICGGRLGFHTGIPGGNCSVAREAELRLDWAKHDATMEQDCPKNRKKPVFRVDISSPPTEPLVDADIAVKITSVALNDTSTVGKIRVLVENAQNNTRVGVVAASKNITEGVKRVSEEAGAAFLPQGIFVDGLVGDLCIVGDTVKGQEIATLYKSTFCDTNGTLDVKGAGLVLLVPSLRSWDNLLGFYGELKSVLVKLEEAFPHVAVLSPAQGEYNSYASTRGERKARTYRDMIVTASVCTAVPMVSPGKLSDVVLRRAPLEMLPGRCLEGEAKREQWAAAVKK